MAEYGPTESDALQKRYEIFCQVNRLAPGTRESLGLLVGQALSGRYGRKLPPHRDGGDAGQGQVDMGTRCQMVPR